MAFHSTHVIQTQPLSSRVLYRHWPGQQTCMVTWKFALTATRLLWWDITKIVGSLRLTESNPWIFHPILIDSQNWTLIFSVIYLHMNMYSTLCPVGGRIKEIEAENRAASQRQTGNYKPFLASYSLAFGGYFNSFQPLVCIMKVSDGHNFLWS